jgi:hypothetical protein
MKSTDGLLKKRSMCTDSLNRGRPDELLALAACS